MLRINLGCGERRRREGEIGLDTERRVKPDILCDLSKGIPLRSDSVDEVYTSHFLEHLHTLYSLLREIVRVCKSDAKVEVVVPYWSAEVAMFNGHKHTYPPEYFRQLEEYRHLHFDEAGCLVVESFDYSYYAEGLEFCEKLGITPEEGRRFLNNIVYEMTVTMKVMK